MTEQSLSATQQGAESLEQVVIVGDLAKLSPTQRATYYRKTCESLGLNWFTKPFDYISLNGKLVLYAKRDCTDQLRKIHNVAVRIVSRERMDDVYVVTAHAELPGGRTDEAIGAVNISGLKADALANALMKAETKSKRRVTLSIVGLGWLDETETETVSEAHPTVVNIETGEIKSPSPAADVKPQITFAQWLDSNKKSFWARMNELGLDKDTVHAEFGVASMNEWAHGAAETKPIVELLDYCISLGIGLLDVHAALDVPRICDWFAAGRTREDAQQTLSAWQKAQEAAA